MVATLYFSSSCPKKFYSSRCRLNGRISPLSSQLTFSFSDLKSSLTCLIKMHPRGKSVEPGELNATRPNYVSRRQMRARSAGPISTRDRTSRLLQNQYDQAGAEQQMASSLPRQPDRALINQHVNPYQEFPSLRRGFTLEGRH